MTQVARPGRTGGRHTDGRGMSAGALLLVCVLATGASAIAGPVHVDAEAQSHLGLKIVHMDAARRASEIDAFAKVLDPGPLVQLVADLQTAQAAAVASSAEGQRALALNRNGDGVSTRDAETARAQARADQLRVTFLTHRLGLEWGPGLTRMSAAARNRLVDDLAAGRAALVHVDTHNNDGQDGARQVRIDIGADSVPGVVIGPARGAEPRLQSSGLIVEVRGPRAIRLSVGLTQSAHIQSTDPHDGVIVPRPAVIRFRGADWVFVKTGPASFERRLVSGPIPEPRGFFVTRGLSTADEVVVDGAAALFAVEQNTAAGAR